MIISHNEKILFIHIPKNSGTEMSNVLKKKYSDSLLLKWCERDGPNRGIDKMHLYYDVIHEYFSKSILQQYFKFCIVRNPYNKLYSAWNFIKERHNYENVNDFVKYKLNQDFIFGKELEIGDARVHYRPQYTFVFDNKGDKFVNYILKYENLNNDIKELNSEHNLEIPLYANQNINKNYINFFNKESIKKINQLYFKDFLYFNYQMIKID